MKKHLTILAVLIGISSLFGGIVNAQDSEYTDVPAVPDSPADSILWGNPAASQSVTDTGPVYNTPTTPWNNVTTDTPSQSSAYSGSLYDYGAADANGLQIGSGGYGGTDTQYSGGGADFGNNAGTGGGGGGGRTGSGGGGTSSGGGGGSGGGSSGSGGSYFGDSGSNSGSNNYFANQNSTDISGNGSSNYSASGNSSSNSSSGNNLSSLISKLINYIKLLVPFIIALALLVFIWGIFKLVFAGGSEVDVKEGTKFMTWGIVSLFVMVSVWGLVAILTKTFFNDNVVIPQLKTTMLVKETV